MRTLDVSDPRIRRRLIAAAAAGVVFLILAGIGIYGLITGPRTGSAADPTVSEPSSTAPQTPGPTTAPRLPVVPRSADPGTFARYVAEALFTWDTASGFLPLDYTRVILDVGDPSGTEQAGLAADVAAYLPARETWLELRKYLTTQHLTIDNLYVPEAWETAVEQAQPGQLAEGTTAYTIEGTRHRAGVWNDEPVTSEHAVSFTVFIVCPPDGDDDCHLLRLSQLDNPLK
ncbi:hypothetical protein BAURA86_00891 [Brevibacterium aurantiacum]|uniref:Uncharacterized protein n=1 Tax=Brevibacterium aurantiacum TaxID=273384 RepID=A0A2H1IRJ2_BREAU|nr:hypothetical protein [Brevibacterium aurantiacum]SMX77720.1 hypothetical protein BAURA86_00891 [Brevibacterium aurantiacum]